MKPAGWTVLKPAAWTPMHSSYWPTYLLICQMISSSPRQPTTVLRHSNTSLTHSQTTLRRSAFNSTNLDHFKSIHLTKPECLFETFFAPCHTLNDILAHCWVASVASFAKASSQLQNSLEVTVIFTVSVLPHVDLCQSTSKMGSGGRA